MVCYVYIDKEVDNDADAMSDLFTLQGPTDERLFLGKVVVKHGETLQGGPLRSFYMELQGPYKWLKVDG